MHSTDCVLVVDWGTTKVHTNIVSLSDGSLKGSACLEYSAVAPRVIGEGLAPGVVWRTAELALERLLSKDLSAVSLKALSFSHFAYCAIPADKNGESVGNIVYGMDTHCLAEMGEFSASMPDSEFSSHTGCGLNLLQLPSKLLWLQKSAKAEKYLSLQQYVLSRLGFSAADYSCTGQGLMDIVSGELSQPLLSACGVSADMFGESTDSATVVGETNRFGSVRLPCRMPVVLGAHDAVCGVLGMGVPPEGGDMLANCAGTADLLCAFGGFRNAWPQFPEICATASVTRGSCCWHVGPASGLVLDWAASRLGGIGLERALRLAQFDPASRVRAIVDGGTLLTSLLNMDISTRFGEIFTSVTEALAFALRRHADALAALSARPIMRLRIGASGAKSDYQVQLKADVFGLPVERVKNLEVSSLGAAIIAAVAIGRYYSYDAAIDAMVQVERTFSPDAARGAVYAERYEEYLKALAETSR